MLAYALALQQGPTGLVAHSFGGMIVTEAGVNPKVSAVVDIAARCRCGRGLHGARKPVSNAASRFDPVPATTPPGRACRCDPQSALVLWMSGIIDVPLTTRLARIELLRLFDCFQVGAATRGVGACRGGCHVSSGSMGEGGGL